VFQPLYEHLFIYNTARWTWPSYASDRWGSICLDLNVILWHTGIPWLWYLGQSTWIGQECHDV